MITWNPNDIGWRITLSDNNLYAHNNTTHHFNGSGVRATHGKINGKWYFEFHIPNSYPRLVGIASLNQTIELDVSNYSNFQSCRLFETIRGQKNSEAGINQSYASGSRATNMIIGVAVDMDLGTIAFHRNGINLGIAFNNLLELGEIYAFGGVSSAETPLVANFGATEFGLLNSNLELWEQLVEEGYKPYDDKSAGWFKSSYSLIKASNEILTFEDNKFVKLNEVNLTNFENRGLRDLSILKQLQTGNIEFEGDKSGNITTAKVNKELLSKIKELKIQ